MLALFRRAVNGRRLGRQALLGALLTAVWLLSAGSAQAQTGSAAEIVRLVNQVRSGVALPPLQPNAQLTAAAQRHADWMARTGRYTHTADGTTPQDRATAAGYGGRATENIVGGTGMTPNQGVIWWQNSPVHYAALTSAFYTEIGAGFAVSGDGQNMYVIVLGNPSGRPTASSAAPRPVPIIVTPLALSTPNPDGSIVHTVGRGQALWTLAAYYEVDLTYLLRLNNLTENQFVQPGDRILIRLPDGAPTPTPLPTPTPPIEHSVRAGQTLWSIAAFYNLTLDELLWMNGLTAEAVLQPGDLLRVRRLPGELPPPTATPIVFHTIGAGDTLWGVALRYGLTLEQLLAFNALSENAVLQIGAQVRIRPPDPTPTATPTPTAEASAPATPAVALPGAAVAAAADPPTPTPTPTPAATVAPTPTPTPSGVQPDAADTAADANRVARLTMLGVLGLLLAFGLWRRWRVDEREWGERRR